MPRAVAWVRRRLDVDDDEPMARSIWCFVCWCIWLARNVVSYTTTDFSVEIEIVKWRYDDV